MVGGAHPTNHDASRGALGKKNAIHSTATTVIDANNKSQPLTQPEALEPSYCIGCDYDIRGQVGDPIVCPECGYSVSRADYALAFKRHQTRRQRRIHQVAICSQICLTLCGAGILSLVLPHYLPIPAAVPLIPPLWFLTIMIVPYPYCVYILHRSVVCDAPFFRTLLRFHLRVGLTFLVIPTVVLVSFVSPIYIALRYFSQYVLVKGLCLCSSYFLAYYSGRFCYRVWEKFNKHATSELQALACPDIDYKN